MLRRLMFALAAGLVLFGSNAGAAEPVHRIGVLVGVLPPDLMKVWLQELREHGWVVGGNLLIRLLCPSLFRFASVALRAGRGCSAAELSHGDALPPA